MKTPLMLMAILPFLSTIHFSSHSNNTLYISSKSDTGKVRILLLMDDDYGANYNVDDESMNIAELFQSYGWELCIAALSDTVRPCEGAVQYFNLGPEATDTLISEITDLSPFQALIILPGRSHNNLIKSKDALDLIRTANESGLVIAAWCRGVRVLASAGVIRGVRVTGYSDYIEEYRNAGAEYIPDNPPPVVEGNIITTVRSRYYRTQMCEAIRKVVEENLHPVTRKR